MSLRWRIALGLAAIAAVICVLAATAAYISTERRLSDEVDDSLRSHALVPEGGAFDPDGFRDQGPGNGSCPPGLLQQASAAQVVARDGTVQVCRGSLVQLPISSADRKLQRGQFHIRTVSVKGNDYRVITTAAGDGRLLQIGRSLEENLDVLSSLRTRLALISLFGVLAAGLLGWLLARRIVRPIERLRSTAEHIAQTQDLDAPIEVTGTDEVASLTNSFSTMVGALAESRRQQQRLITDASHELRTPLTALQTNAELLERQELLSDDQRGRVAQGIQVEVGELAALVSEIVQLATDNGGTTEAAETVSLGDLADHVVDRARRRTSREVTLAAEGDDDVSVRPHMVERAISNLVDNAIKYGDGAINVSVLGRRVEVRDHGAGLTERDLPHVFERFYRADTARTEPGSGLGLSIVEQIASVHGGTVTAGNHDGGGAVFAIEFPSVQARHS